MMGSRELSAPFRRFLELDGRTLSQIESDSKGHRSNVQRAVERYPNEWNSVKNGQAILRFSETPLATSKMAPHISSFRFILKLQCPSQIVYFWTHLTFNLQKRALIKPVFRQQILTPSFGLNWVIGFKVDPLWAPSRITTESIPHFRTRVLSTGAPFVTNFVPRDHVTFRHRVPSTGDTVN